MTREDTIKILAILYSIYGQGKASPEETATAWHLILGKYDRETVMAAVIHFAENDCRDYATLPAPGLIVAEIRAEEARREAEENRRARAANQVYAYIARGQGYGELSADAQALCTPEEYEAWLKIDPVKWAKDAKTYKGILKERLPLLAGATQEDKKS